MKKIIFLLVAIVSFSSIGNTALAMLDSYNSTSGIEKELILPEAAANSSVVFIGRDFDIQKGKMVEGYAIIHREDKKVKPDKPGKPDKEEKSNCYEFLARGAKWKNVENWVVNPTNYVGLDKEYILQNISYDINKWENAAGSNILGNGNFDLSISVEDVQSLDNKNAVYFAGINDARVIAVTYIWGIFGGAPKNRELAEWDQVYNTNFSWSSLGEVDKMDFESIATHELGHSVGMGDLYNTSCIEETMYGYASEGEISKRDLNLGDIVGIRSLYR